jgi:ribosomal protein S18 acetylase RimI-like enzyme
MTLRIELASHEQAELVHQTMRAAYAEYDGVLTPPSGAASETVADVLAAMGKGGALLARDGGVVVGSARFEWRTDHLYVGRVAVVPAYRGQGVGSALMRRIEEIAHEGGRGEIRLGVRMSLPGNLAFYRSLGYEVVKTEPHPKGGDRVAWMGKRV